jgi:hypothetical protein
MVSGAKLVRGLEMGGRQTADDTEDADKEPIHLLSDAPL